MATKKFSPAQIAAQKLFAERARAGTLGKGKRKANPVKGEKIFKTGDYVKTDRGEIGRVSFYKDQPKGYANVYRLIDVKANDPYASTFLENGNFINGTRLKAYKQTLSQKYNEAAVNKSIASSRSKISASEGKTIKRLLMGRTGNPVTETLIYGLAPGETRDYMEELMYAGGQKLTQAQIDKVFKAAGDAGYHSFRVAGFDPTMKPDFAAAVRRKRNPDKSKPRAYVNRASQATGRPPVKGTKAGNRLITRRKKALSAPAGYFPNPKAAMMTGYQVICMHPKKHVVGIFKTMAEAKLVATAMANAKGVPYGVKAVKVHKTHFAV